MAVLFTTVAKLTLRLLVAIRVVEAVLWLENRFGFRQCAVALLFHHIAERENPHDDRSSPLSQVEDGISLSSFEKQIAQFCRWYEPVRVSDLRELLDRGRRQGKGRQRKDGLVVTFDDGYRDNLTLAAPVLENYHAHAIVFLATNYIDSNRQFWWVRLNDIFRQLSYEKWEEVARRLLTDVQLAVPCKHSQLDGHHWKRSARAQLAAQLEHKPLEIIESVLDRLEMTAGHTDSTCLPLMSWREIRMIGEQGFEVGAHTVSHPRLSTLVENACREEIRDGIDAIAENTGRRPTAFAYPYGDYTENTVEVVRETGLQLAFTARPGLINGRCTSMLKLPRIQFDSSNRAKTIGFILLLKLAKYFPSLMRPILSRIVGEPFEVT